jgi:hypothetical protein
MQASLESKVVGGRREEHGGTQVRTLRTRPIPLYSCEIDARCAQTSSSLLPRGLIELYESSKRTTRLGVVLSRLRTENCPLFRFPLSLISSITVSDHSQTRNSTVSLYIQYRSENYAGTTTSSLAARCRGGSDRPSRSLSTWTARNIVRERPCVGTGQLTGRGGVRRNFLSD